MRGEDLSLPEARRLAVASQEFGSKPARPSIPHLRRLATRLHAFQMDSVNVLARAHYLPAFARLGAYSMDALDTLAYRKRELFEYWGHAACLLPISLYPLVRYRMHKHVEQTQAYMRSDRGAYMAKAYAEVAERGPTQPPSCPIPANVGEAGGAGGARAMGKRRSSTFEMYVPASKRVYGYYVCPFLLGDTLVARCDLKADRERKVLMVRSAFLEPGQRGRHVVSNLARELRHMQAWLELDRMEVGERGDLAALLRRSV